MHHSKCKPQSMGWGRYSNSCKGNKKGTVQKDAQKSVNSCLFYKEIVPTETHRDHITLEKISDRHPTAGQPGKPLTESSGCINLMGL